MALEGDFQQYYGLDVNDIKTGGLCIFRAARLMSVLPRDCRLSKIVGDQEYTLQENLLIGILDFLKVDTYYNMVSAGASVDKKSWTQIVSGAPKSILQQRAEENSPQPEAEYVHPRDALRAVRRMVHTKAYNQFIAAGGK